MKFTNIKFIISLFVFVVFVSLTSMAQESTDYNATIKSADEYYQNRDYYNAKAAYQLASKLKPEENYPKEKIQEIIDLLKAEMAIRGDYDTYVETADEAFDAKDYNKAIEFYEKALALIAYESHPNNRLEESKKLKVAAEEKNAQYTAAIQNADALYAEQQYEQAISAYREAANIDESQKYPNDQIMAINNLLKTQVQNQQAYETAILKGDQQLNYQKFADALQQYELALKAKPTDTYAQQQITLMKDFIEKEKQYDQITAKADELYVSQELSAAKAEYQKALDLLPAKTYALNMISKINANLDKELAKKQKLEEDYQKAISEADVLFREQKYQSAYSKYNKALELKPNEDYPKSQLQEIDIILATGYVEINCYVFEGNKGLFDSRVQLLQGNRVIETAEIGTNGRHKFKLDLNKEYQIKVYKTDYVQKIFNINTALPRDVNHNNIYTYEFSVELFQSCSTDLSVLDQPLTEIKYYKDKGNFYFDENQAQRVIDQVNSLKKDCEEIRKQEAQKEEYDDLIAEADKDFNQQKYADALENYSAALLILPNQEFPQQKIANINTILADLDKYQALIVSGDAKFNAKDYENALYDYYAAKNMKPKEEYPQQRISEIDAILNAQKALLAQYEAQVRQADSLFGLDSLLMAKSSYQLAQNIKKEEDYPQKQINLIDGKLKELEAFQKRYDDAIANADKLFEEQKLNDARSAYLVASQIKPDEMYPKYKIEDINTIEEQRRLRALTNNYYELIAQADGEFENKVYIAALELYKKAAEIKPKEAYPPAQIEKINVLMAEQEANNQKYDALIAQADAEFIAKSYAPSFDNYKLASAIKSGEEYPKQRMAEIEAIMKKMADLEIAYQDVIKQADEQFELQAWTNALAFYQQAADLKPKETYPPQKISEINILLQNLADLDAAYQAAIAKADREFTAQEWNASKASYELALGMKPNEKYPQDQLALIEQKLLELAQLQAQYDSFIQEADLMFENNQLIDSKSKYQQALNLKPDELYPPQRMAEIDALLQALADKDAAYNAAITKADQEFTAEDWNNSKSSYQAALKIKAEEEYPQSQIDLIDQKLNEIAMAAAALDAQYQALIAEADQLFSARELIASKTKYQAALTLKPQETYPPQKIAEIDALLQQLADKEAAYAAAIEKADQYFNQQEWNLALTAYENALGIKSEEQYPKDQITSCQLKIKEIEDRQAQFDALIAVADEKFAAQSYVEAKAKYEEALQVMDEQYPKDKIVEIDVLLKALADQDALYQQLIESADMQFSENAYNPALSTYKQAAEVKPSEQYPKDKIAEIEALLLQLAETDRLYSEAIAAADRSRDQQIWESAISSYEEAISIKSEENYPKEQIELINAKLKAIADQKAAYDAAIAQGDQFFSEEAWQKSISAYQSALDIKANEVYPQTQIQEINRILKEIADRDAAYQLAIDEADAFYQSKDWSNALTKYELAASIKTQESYPKEKIAELNGILGELAALQAKYDAFIQEGDQAFNTEDYSSATNAYKSALEIKSNEEYPQLQLNKIEEILAQQAALQKQFDELIKEADKQFAKESWTESLSLYQQALEIKSEEVYPKEQINIINQKLQAIADTKAQYDALIAEADQMYQKEEYESSLLKYEAALTVLPNEQYPKDQMKTIRDLMAALAQKNAEYDKIIVKADDLLLQESFEKSKEQYQEALNLFPERPYPTEQITKIDELISKYAQYESFVASGDEQFKNKEYDLALVSFNKARTLLPAKTYPPQKIAEIEQIMQLMAMTQAAYDAAIQKADAHFNASEYEWAKTSYQEAIDQISSEVYPRQKIMEIDQILADLARKRVQFDKIIAQANKAFDENSFDMSLAKYQEALAIFPEETYPQQRIEEIKGILAQMANQKERYESLVAQGDQAFDANEYKNSIQLFQQALSIFPNESYPPQKIAEAEAALAKLQRELDVAYQKAIDEGDRNFRKRDWDPAKLAYQNASEIKPEELYPKEKLAEINKILEQELMAQQKEYDRHIADGERFYSTKYYQESILAFEQALGVFPNEKYPVEMIDKIYEMIKKTSMLTLLDDKKTLNQNVEEKFKFDPIAFKDRSENYILLEVKRLNPDAQVKLFVNFGKGGAQNGGYSIPLKSRDGYHSYFVSIGKQVRWVNQDNDYISLLPEGGDVEIKLIKLSRNGI